MSKHKSTIIGTAILAVIFIGIVIIAFATVPKNYISVLDDGTYFDMWEWQLLKIKGDPTIAISNDLLTGSSEYTFDEKLYGHDAEATYYFYNAPFGKRLFSYDACIRQIDYEEAKRIKGMAEESIRSQYESYPDFYYQPDGDDGATMFSVSLGTNMGTDSCSFDIDYQDGTFAIYAIHLS